MTLRLELRDKNHTDKTVQMIYGDIKMITHKIKNVLGLEREQ
jgi:hypothetical protein